MQVLWLWKDQLVETKWQRLLRDGEILAEGKVDTLKRFKDDVMEVKAGFECGIRLDSFDAYKEGDVIETFELDKIAQHSDFP